MSTLANPVSIADPGNVWLDVLCGGTKWDSGAPAKTTIKVFVAGDQTVDFGGEKLHSFAARAAERTAVDATLQVYENIINVDFVQAANFNEADIYFAHVSDTAADGNLGVAYLPGDTANPATHDKQGELIINRDAYGSSDLASLARGGYDFITYIHEFGHTLGLLHPHDAPDRFPGVTSAFDDYGDFNMNQGVYTVMSYNDGFPTGPIGTSPSDLYGFSATPMALDVAALQYYYGANMSYRTGNDVYVLPSENAAGTSYSCLWDAGGRDTIVNDSAKPAIIDLRAASLLAAPSGGGLLSAVSGIYGGFTIAHDVIIENAVGGSAGDTIKGSNTPNRLAGNGGNDIIKGFNGNDIIQGGTGSDKIEGGVGHDVLVFTSITDSTALTSTCDTVLDFVASEDILNLAAIDADAAAPGDQAFVFRGEAPVIAVRNSADVWFQRFDADDATYVYCSNDADADAEMIIKLDGRVNLTAVDFLL